MTYVEIKFDDEIRTLILLASLPNSWEPMRAAVSNSVGKGKLQLNDVRDRVLAEEVRRVDSGEGTLSSSVLNLENRGRNNERNSNRGRGRSKSRNGRDKSKPRRKLECWNYGRTDHLKKNCRTPKKEDKLHNANTVIEEVQEALILSVDSLTDS